MYLPPSFEIENPKTTYLPLKNKYGNLQGCKTIGVCGGCEVCGEFDADAANEAKVW